MQRKDPTILIGILLATTLMGFALFRYTPLCLLLIPFNQNPGFFFRPHFQAIVEEVRASGIAAGETKEFLLENLSNPKSVRPRKPDENLYWEGAGHIWAERTPEGALKVVIETKDLGHAGEYGFAYSEIPLEPEPFGAGWFTIDVPGYLNIVKPEMKVDNHWWQVVFNLG